MTWVAPNLLCVGSKVTGGGESSDRDGSESEGDGCPNALNVRGLLNGIRALVV